MNTQKFKETICKIVGHTFDTEIDLIVCQRCGYERVISWQRLADAMVQPLRATLDYRGIGRKILKIEDINDKDNDSSKGKDASGEEGKDS